MRSNAFFSALRGPTAFKLLLLLAVFLPLFATNPALGQTFEVLYSFKGQPDGWDPGSVLPDESGNVYGTTYSGGAHYKGTAFKISPGGSETILYSFLAVYGAEPESASALGAKNVLYGTTVHGGDYNYGVVFKLAEKGQEVVLHSFDGGSHGALPNSLIRDDEGMFYGTTCQDAGNACTQGPGCGMVFKMDAAGKVSVLHRFAGGRDGCNPMGGLVRDSVGNLYGTTWDGGDSNHGTAFKVDSGGKETVLYSFGVSEGDGIGPIGNIALDKDGSLYGTTYGGGVEDCGGGCGTVFKLEANGNETVLHQFTGKGGDGENPISGVAQDASGILYGATPFGGDTNCGFSEGCGVVFRLEPGGRETILYSFTGGADGAFPDALALDYAGNIYGAASRGGNPSCGAGDVSGCGTVFKLVP